MAKPLPTVFLKQNLDTSWRTVNFILQNASLSDQIGHLYVIDIEFDHTKATEKQKVYNEISSPIIEKQKIIDPCERLVYQLFEQYFTIEKGNPRTYRATKKAHATLFKKYFNNVFRTTLFCH